MEAKKGVSGICRVVKKTVETTSGKGKDKKTENTSKDVTVMNRSFP